MIKIKLLVILSLVLQGYFGAKVEFEQSGGMYLKKGLGKSNMEVIYVI